MALTVVKYRLRGGQMQPALANCGGSGTPTFFSQTFGAEKTVVNIDDAKINLLASTDMQGQKPGNIEDPTYIQTTYSRASYQGRPLRTTTGDLVFSAVEEFVSEWIEEEMLGIA
jgi:hypothetical protein